MDYLKRACVRVDSIDEDIEIKQLSIGEHAEVFAASEEKGKHWLAGLMTLKYGVPRWTDKTTDELAAMFTLEQVNDICGHINDLSSTDAKKLRQHPERVFVFELALALGVPVFEIERWPAWHLKEWAQFYELRPFGATRDNYHAAIIARTVASVNGADVPLESFFYKDAQTHDEERRKKDLEKFKLIASRVRQIGEAKRRGDG